MTGTYAIDYSEIMNLQEKKSVLIQLYEIYDEYISKKKLACDEKCSGCCTINVTMTSAEGHLIFSELKRSLPTEVFDRLKTYTDKKRFQPKLTPNGLVAELVSNQPDQEEVENNPAWGECPLLIDNMCSVYVVRPFECRSFVSSTNCGETSAAEMPEEIIAINNIFKQYIEHTDADGTTGNLVDVLLYLDTQRKRHLIRNQTIPTLMADPKFQGEIEQIIDRIQSIRIKL